VPLVIDESRRVSVMTATRGGKTVGAGGGEAEFWQALSVAFVALQVVGPRCLHCRHVMKSWQQLLKKEEEKERKGRGGYPRSVVSTSDPHGSTLAAENIQFDA
jgi:hypothetical protein